MCNNINCNETAIMNSFIDLDMVQRKMRKSTMNRTISFSDKNNLHVSIPPSRSLMRLYSVEQCVNKGLQCFQKMSSTYVSTDCVKHIFRGVNHNEGGWPKDINIADEEQTTRYKKKIEKKENYIQQLKGMTKIVENSILQNNAVNIYENYFEESEPVQLVEQYSSKTVNVYRDYLESKRSITRISWSPDEIHFASSHHNPQTHSNIFDCYLWDVQNPNFPLSIITPPAPAPCVEYNPKDNHILASGLATGQIAVWDTRTSSKPVTLTQRETSHRDLVTNLLWTSTKTSSEFFSGSTEGQVLWWDMRKMDNPYDRLLLDPIKIEQPELARAHGVSVLEYEPTIPTKFMVGSEHGMVFNCNKKWKQPTDKILAKMSCHYGPVFAVERNPSFIKNFLTVGDWQAKIWCEECRESPIIWTKEYAIQLTFGCWSTTRASLFFLSRMDGILDVCDVLYKLDGPILSIKLSDHPLLSLRAHRDGKLIAAGNSNGNIYLVQVSDNLTVSTIYDKPAFSAMLERETRREKILEGKMRELKLKEKEIVREKIKEELRLETGCEAEDSSEAELIEAASNNFYSNIKCQNQKPSYQEEGSRYSDAAHRRQGRMAQQ